MRPAERRWFDEAVARRAASSGASAAVIARRLEARLAAGEPLQYVLGTWSFRGHELRVDHRALIPRYETEQLVEHVLAAVRTGMRVLDVGTGSGAIAISLALEGPRLEVTGSDVDPRALALARENVRATGALVTLVRRSWFEGAEPESLDVVVANPPTSQRPSGSVSTLRCECSNLGWHSYRARRVSRVRWQSSVVRGSPCGREGGSSWRSVRHKGSGWWPRRARRATVM